MSADKDDFGYGDDEFGGGGSVYDGARRGGIKKSSTIDFDGANPMDTYSSARDPFSQARDPFSQAPIDGESVDNYILSRDQDAKYGQYGAGDAAASLGVHGGQDYSAYQQVDAGSNYDMNFNYDDQSSQGGYNNQGADNNYYRGGTYSEYDYGNYYNNYNDFIDGDNKKEHQKFERAETEYQFPDRTHSENVLYTSMSNEFRGDTMLGESERAGNNYNQLSDTFDANDVSQLWRNQDPKDADYHRSGVAGSSEVDGKSSNEAASSNVSSAKQRQIKNNLGTLKSNNERFLFLFREAIKRFRIPQYGFSEMHGIAKNQVQYSAEWKLTQPQLVNNSYIVYDIEGKDHLGPFNAQRRYNNFFELRNALYQNWPGVYIPNVPPKKAMGNKDIEFVVERRYYLERFFMQLADIEYLRTSDEVKIFIRPEISAQGQNSGGAGVQPSASSSAAATDIDKTLSKLGRPSNAKLL